MSIPANPLDIFATYTYHFELHAADSWDKLKDLATKDENKATNRFEPNGTLLINTRKDAHQVINDVRFLALAEATAKTELLTPVGTLSMTISEPGGFSFIEKLATLRSNFQVTSAASEGLTFLLKIFFVGRTPTNEIRTVTAKLIPMVIMPNVSATFNEAGGRYSMAFVMSATLGATDNPASGAPMNFSFVKRTVSFYSGTVEGALKKLEQHLNDGYEEIFKKEGNAEVGKRLVYKVTHDPEIKGEIKSLNKDSWAPNEPSKFVFSPTLQIANFIHTILKQSPELQKKVGESKAALQKEGHPGLFMPVIQPRVCYRDDSIEVTYHVAVNRGGMQKSFIFDYYFADAGKNVDVMSYEVKFQYLGAWTPTKITTGYDWSLNQSSTMQVHKPSLWKEHNVTPDTTRKENTVEVERSSLAIKKNDPKPQPGVTGSDRTGYNNMPFDSTPFVRLGSDAQADFQTAISSQQTFEIRGNLDLLDCTAYYPDASDIGALYNGQNIWIKVNIWMPDSRFEGGKRQFYYTNYYKLISVENIFSGGQFKQMLTVMMAPEAENQK
jgi:hypothetical protein